MRAEREKFLTQDGKLMHPLMQAAHDFGNELFEFLKIMAAAGVVAAVLWVCVEEKK